MASDKIFPLTVACSKLAEAHHQLGELYGYLDPLTERVYAAWSSVEGRLTMVEREEKRQEVSA